MDRKKEYSKTCFLTRLLTIFKVRESGLLMEDGREEESMVQFMPGRGQRDRGIHE